MVGICLGGMPFRTCVRSQALTRKVLSNSGSDLRTKAAGRPPPGVEASYHKDNAKLHRVNVGNGLGLCLGDGMAFYKSASHSRTGARKDLDTRRCPPTAPLSMYRHRPYVIDCCPSLVHARSTGCLSVSDRSSTSQARGPHKPHMALRDMVGDMCALRTASSARR